MDIGGKVHLVSGGTGFIGRRLVQSLNADGVTTRVLSRSGARAQNSVVADLVDRQALAVACAGADTIFHCAGYAHAFSSLSGDDTEMHWRVNFEGTRNLVEVAGQAGVKRFVFLSSVKAMSEPGNKCVDEDFPGEPETAYGQSKRAAEAAVLAAGLRFGMQVVNLRLAMVYGPGGRGNLERMGRLVGRGVFPPLPETGNHRSLVHVDDVVSAMRQVATDVRAVGKTYIVAHHLAPSGRGLYDALRTANGLPPCRWSVPVQLWHLAASFGDGLESLLRRRLPLDREVVGRLLGSAWYSPARIEQELNWSARVSLTDGLAGMFKQ
ncbi:MAG: NAD-dependent epimerase/dehydratase family protein [Pseudomonadota bacterium]